MTHQECLLYTYTYYTVKHHHFECPAFICIRKLLHHLSQLKDTLYKTTQQLLNTWMSHYMELGWRMEGQVDTGSIATWQYKVNAVKTYSMTKTAEPVWSDRLSHNSVHGFMRGHHQLHSLPETFPVPIIKGWIKSKESSPSQMWVAKNTLWD